MFSNFSLFCLAPSPVFSPEVRSLQLTARCCFSLEANFVKLCKAGIEFVGFLRYFRFQDLRHHNLISPNHMFESQNLLSKPSADRTHFKSSRI